MIRTETWRWELFSRLMISFAVCLAATTVGSTIVKRAFWATALSLVGPAIYATCLYFLSRPESLPSVSPGGFAVASGPREMHFKTIALVTLVFLGSELSFFALLQLCLSR